MKVKELKTILDGLDDDVELYYPHHYKGYGLIPVNKIKIGDVSGKTVGVFDWETLLLYDDNFISKPGETREDIIKKRVEENG